MKKILPFLQRRAPAEEELIAIHTTRYSELLRRILSHHASNLELLIDGRTYTDADRAELLSTWCTNHKIKSTKNLIIKWNGAEVFGFHDDPSEFWAAMSEREFIDELANARLLRYRVLKAQ